MNIERVLMVTSLLHHAVLLKISDPWELGESLGWEPLSGKIIAVDHDKRPSAVLVKLDKPVRFRNENGEFFVGSPRHVGDQIVDLGKGIPLFCGFTRISPEQAQSDGAFDLSRWRGGLVIIGELQLQ
jgi:hypothetical protein